MAKFGKLLIHRTAKWHDDRGPGQFGANSDVGAERRDGSFAMASRNERIEGGLVDCLHSARLAVAAGDYETAVKAAVALGDDTDTTACVAGGIAGLRDGADAIPVRWRDALRGKELYEPLLQMLKARG